MLSAWTIGAIASKNASPSSPVLARIRPASAADVSGPVGILKISYTIAEGRSLIDFLYFMALISICVAVFNFLPIPVLDGGHLLMLIIERIKGSPVSIKVQEIATYAGLFLIIIIFVLVTFNDIIKVINNQI